MKITKFGHSCMLVEEGSARILIDPGAYSSQQNTAQNLDVILITHEHKDHLDPKSIGAILKNNSGVKIYTNKGVGKILTENSIAFELIEDGESVSVRNVSIEGVGQKHAQIHRDFPIVDDTGFMIAEKFFYAGDAFHIPPKKVQILALPVVAPWMRVEESLDFALEIKPKVCFAVHDAFLKFAGPFHLLPETILTKAGIEFKILEEGKEYEF